MVDWGGFTIRQGGALGAGALRNLMSCLHGRFPARFKAIHFLSPPLYVQATFTIIKPFLDEKTRKKVLLITEIKFKKINKKTYIFLDLFTWK